MSELFDIPETLSPRLAWLKKHGIFTNSEFFDDSDEEYRWGAWLEGCQDYLRTGHGDTEDDALVDLAKKQNLKLWNEQ